MFHTAKEEKYTSINRIAIAQRAPLEEADRPSPYPAVFISVTSRENHDDVKDIGKHDFPSVLPHPTLSNAIRSSLDMRIRNWPRGRRSA